MELTGEQLLPVPRERVWAALLDSETLRHAIPGCESVLDEGGGRYAVRVVASVGPVKARFKGRLLQQDLQPPQRYTLSFEGDGGVAGFAKGSAEVELTPAGDADHPQTLLTYRAQAQIGGRLAQIGSRLVDATAARLSAQFFERLTALLTTPAAAAGETTAERHGPQDPTATVSQDRTVPSPPFAPGPVPQGPGRALVTVQMPAWTWAFTVTVIALLAAWLVGH